MSDQKIPHRSNFLEKFAAVEVFLQNETKPKRELGNKEEEVNADNLPNIISEIPVFEEELKCNKCGTSRSLDDVFCGTCGNKLQEN